MQDVIGYIRVSTKEQGDSRNGLEAQMADIERFAAVNGLNIIEIREEVVSGKYDLDRRPVLKKTFMDAAKLKAMVLTSKIDRLSRKASFIFNLMDSPARFVVAECGINAMPMDIHIRAVIAEDERRRIGERTRVALKQLKNKGKALGNANPKIAKHMDEAIQKSVLTNKREADTFADNIRPVIERMRGVGMSVNKIAEELNQQGNKTARGGQWYAKTVVNVINRWETA